MKDKLLLTGANGFLGSYFIKSFDSLFNIVGVYRNKNQVKTAAHVLIDKLDSKTDWSKHLADVDFVVHTAARVHVMKDESLDPISEFRKVNTNGTLNLAKQAADAGVKRFVFISSIKVNGEFTNEDTKFTANDQYIPTDPYGLSKYEAEIGLKEISQNTGMDLVIIRPPLIYGPNVKANFRSMIKWVNKGVPLPFGSINNKRSLVSLTNLVDFIKVCLSHPDAANEIFLISDGVDVSTTELLHQIGNALNKRAKLIPIPVVLMKFVAKMIGKKDIADRIFGNLQLDSGNTNTLLDWQPIVTMEEELKMTVEAYLNE